MNPSARSGLLRTPRIGAIRSAHRATLALAALAFLGPRAAAAGNDFTTRDHWDRIRRAKSHLERHDFGSATKALAPIGTDSPAAKDAAILREQLDQMMAFRLRVGMDLFFDTQPFRYTTQSITVSGWTTTWLKTELGGTSLIVPGSATRVPRWAYGGKFGSTLRLFNASLDLESWLKVHRWNDSRTTLGGGIVGEARWLAPLLLRAGQLRTELYATAAAVEQHAFVDESYLGLALRLPNSLQAEARVSWLSYFDSNHGLLAYSWALYPIVSGSLTVAAGYSGAYSDTQHLRFDPATQRYTPYATPLSLYRHGPIARTSLNAGRLTLKAGIDYALQTSDYEPNSAYWGLHIRRNSSQWDVLGDVEIRLGTTTLTAKYRYLRRYYYDHHETGLYIDVPIS